MRFKGFMVKFMQLIHVVADLIIMGGKLAEKRADVSKELSHLLAIPTLRFGICQEHFHQPDHGEAICDRFWQGIIHFWRHGKSVGREEILQAFKQSLIKLLF